MIKIAEHFQDLLNNRLNCMIPQLAYEARLLWVKMEVSSLEQEHHAFFHFPHLMHHCIGP